MAGESRERQHPGERPASEQWLLGVRGASLGLPAPQPFCQRQSVFKHSFSLIPQFNLGRKQVAGSEWQLLEALIKVQAK